MLDVKRIRTVVNMGGFFEARYAELRCRVCKMMLCCTDCRRKHEQRVHHVHPDCHVCINGKIYISQMQTSGELLQHVKRHHLPLHCVKCRKVYHSLDNLDSHGFACPAMSKQSQAPGDESPLLLAEGMPVSGDSQKNYCSPEMAGSADDGRATSTPLLNDPMIIQVPENITPVETDRIHSNSVVNLATPPDKYAHLRITYISTPTVENIKRGRKKAESFLKTCLKNSTRLNASTTFRTAKESFSRSTDMPPRPAPPPAAAVSAAHVQSAMQPATAQPQPAQTMPAVQAMQPMQRKRSSLSMNETMWMSAINNTVELEKVDDESVAAGKSRHLSLERQHSELGYAVQDAGTSYDPSPQKTGVWASMKSIFKNAMQSISLPKRHGPTKSLKRNRSASDVDVEERMTKRYKLCDVHCRPPIRPAWKKLIPKQDKSIQTDYYSEP